MLAPVGERLKMAIPKGILKSSLDLRESMSLYNQSLIHQCSSGPRHVNFEGEGDKCVMETLESLQSSVGPAASTSLLISKQPDHVAYVLKRFLIGDWELDHEDDDMLLDKILLEFPVFSLNDDYLRALANIIMHKLESVRNLINHKHSEIQGLIEERDRMQRDRSLSLLKSKMGAGGATVDESISLSRGVSPVSGERNSMINQRKV